MPARRPDPQRLLAAINAQLSALGSQPWAGPVTVAALGAGCVTAVIAALDAGLEPQPGVLRGAAIHTLNLLESRVPGRAVEVRIPPYAAIQCVAGPRHTRGTPPNVVEADAVIWILLTSGRMSWAEAVRTGRLRVSGPRADLSEYLPLSAAGPPAAGDGGPPAGPDGEAPTVPKGQPPAASDGQAPAAPN